MEITRRLVHEDSYRAGFTYTFWIPIPESVAIRPYESCYRLWVNAAAAAAAVLDSTVRKFAYFTGERRDLASMIFGLGDGVFEYKN